MGAGLGHPIRPGLPGQKEGKRQLRARRALPTFHLDWRQPPRAPTRRPASPPPAARRPPRGRAPAQRRPAPREAQRPAAAPPSSPRRRSATGPGAERRPPGRRPGDCPLARWRSAALRAQAASEHHLFMVGVWLLCRPPAHQCGWRARPLPGSPSLTPGPTQGASGWEGGPAGVRPLNNRSRLPSPLGPQFLQLEQGEGAGIC